MGTARVSEGKDIKLGSHPGLEVTGTMGPKQPMRALVYLVGKRAYFVIVAGPGNAASSADATRYLDSFRLVEGTAASGPSAEQPAEIVVFPALLMREYHKDRAAADKKYQGKTITVRGNGTTEGKDVVLEPGVPSIWDQAKQGDLNYVVVSFNAPTDAAAARGAVSVRGVCVGINYKGDVHLRGCTLLR